MFNFTVQAIVVVRKAQIRAYSQPCPTLGLIVSGLKYMITPEFSVRQNVPLFWFSPSGAPISFEFSPARENIAILLESDAIRTSQARGMIDIHDGQEWLAIPAHAILSPERVQPWRERVLEMHDAFRQPTAANRLRVELGVLEIIRYLLTQTGEGAAINPASRLKALLDGENWSKSLEELCDEVGGSNDHLRMLFRKEYGINPKKYQQHRRMAQAMELVVGSALCAKEISHALGFRQLSHFSAMFSATFGYSPREGMQRFRYERFAPFTASPIHEHHETKKRMIM